MYSYLTSLDASLAIGLLWLGLVLRAAWPRYRGSRFPRINDTGVDMFSLQAKTRFRSRAKELMKQGLSEHPSGFEVVTDDGVKLILPGQLADLIKDDPRLSHYESLKTEGLLELYGLESLSRANLHFTIIPDAVTAMTRRLVHLVEPLSSEMALILQTQWADYSDWHKMALQPTLLTMVARLSSLAFLGTDMCRNPEWLEVAVNYTLARFAAVRSIQTWPRVLHPFVHWFLPACKTLREHINKGRKILAPLVERERHNEESAEDKQSSVLAWIDRHARDHAYDPTLAQLMLSSVSIHTSADLITKVIIRLCENAELIEALRQEILAATQKQGITYASLKDLILMDSVMKETQRLDPASLAAFQRITTDGMQLPDGTTIPKGTQLVLANLHMHDASVYPDPELFDGYRFLRMRQSPSKIQQAPFTAPSADHLGFGLGKHSCPGRFFAATEIKIMLSHILLKYDFRLPNGQSPEIQNHGFVSVRDPRAAILVRKRRDGDIF
ncbi:hypothetical protein HFD88_000040 [Aspergillus terreus]|nr:hypothetical protein HFD88_000040 [Aspergillus terreus]